MVPVCCKIRKGSSSYLWISMAGEMKRERNIYKGALEWLSLHSMLVKEAMLLLLLSRFSRVRLCATPEMAAYQALLSLGFSRQEHRSGFPFPSPMHESEKWKWSCSVVSDFAIPWTAAHQAPQSMGFSRQEYWSGVPLPSLKWLMRDPQIKTLLSCRL